MTRGPRRGPLIAAVLVIVFSLSSCGGSTRDRPDPASSRPRSLVDLGSLEGRIVFSTLTFRGETPLTDVYVADADGSGVTNLTRGRVGGFDPTWSPDGSKIAYRVEPTGSHGEDSDIWVMDADGSHKKNLTGDGNGNWSPVWSPDGTMIAFASGGSDGMQHIFVMNADGTGRREVATDVEGEYPTWSPDGTKIAFMSQEYGASGENPDYNVYVVDTEGSALTKLTDAQGSDGIPDWSPDGTRIAFTSGRDDCGVSEAQVCESSGDVGPFHTIYVMAADGSVETRLSENQGYYPTWSPDGRLILFSHRDLYVMRSDGSGTAKLPIAGVGEIDFSDWVAPAE